MQNDFLAARIDQVGACKFSEVQRGKDALIIDKALRSRGVNMIRAIGHDILDFCVRELVTLDRGGAIQMNTRAKAPIWQTGLTAQDHSPAQY